MKRAATANRQLVRSLAAGLLVVLCAVSTLAPAAQALDLQRGPREGKQLEPPRKLEPPRRESAAPRAGMSKDSVIELVQSRYKARVIRADQKRTKDGRLYYDIRLLSDEGRVLNIKVDAESGKTL